LLDLAVKRSPGAERVTGCDKKEGDFNRVFVIQLDNGKNVVARLPTSLPSYRRCAISSDVATLLFGVYCPMVANSSADWALSEGNDERSSS